MAFITCPVTDASQKFAVLPAVIAGSRTILYQNLDVMVDGVAERLRHLELKSGDHVAVIHSNSPETILVLFGLWRVGAVACLINPKEPYEAINRQAAAVQCKFLLAPNTLQLGLKVPGAKGVVISNLISHNPVQPQENPEMNRRSDLTRPVTIIFSSGSSGAPKAAVHSLGNHYFNAKGSNEHLPVAPGDRWLLSLPLYHVSGLGIMCRCLLDGGGVVVPSATDELTASIEKYAVTHISLVPTQLIRLLKDENAKRLLPKLKAILLGGAPIPPKLLEHAKELDLPVYITYGLTETASQVATSPCLKNSNLPLTANVLPYRQIRIAADGEILVKGETLFLGYWEGGEIRRPLTADGWFATGDFGQLDNEGLTVTGRKDSMFVSGGENIYPEEIEKALLDIADIEEAVVVPQDDEEFGQRPVAFIRAAGGQVITRRKITTALEKHLPRFKIPQAFYLFPAKVPQGGLKTNRSTFQKFLTEKNTALTLLN